MSNAECRMMNEARRASCVRPFDIRYSAFIIQHSGSPVAATAYVILVPKLLLGNASGEAPASHMPAELAAGRCEAGASQRE